MSVRGSPASAVFEHDVVKGVLSVRIDGVGVSPPDRVSFTRTVTCKDGWTVYFREGKDYGNATSGHINYAWTRLSYSRAEDKSLIVHFISEVESQKGLSGPKKQTVDAWYRFMEEPK
jgi:hypothetical protein